MKSLISRVFAIFTVTIAMAAPGWADEVKKGLLLLAHGAHAHTGHEHHSPASIWNSNVEQMALSLDKQHPTEVAFGMADPQTIQAAVNRLEAKGVSEIAVVPLFVSSHSPIIGNSRYILGLQAELAKTTRLQHLDRVSSTARFRFGQAMDSHPLVSKILLERALAMTKDPAKTTVVLIAHGPNDDGENELWLRDMEVHARFLQAKGGFRTVTALTHRNDAPEPVKAAARAAFRRQVEDAARVGNVVVVPLLLSAGGIEKQVESDLSGLPYRFAQPLMPHPNIKRWVELEGEVLLAPPAPTAR